MTGKEVSYSRQWDDLFGDAPLKAPLPRLDTKRCLPSPSMELQAREPGAARVPFTEDIWVLPKLRNWLFREPWSFYDIMVSGWGRRCGRGTRGRRRPGAGGGPSGASLHCPTAASAILLSVRPQTTGSILGLHLLCLAAPWTFTWPALWWGALLFFACGGLGIDISFHRWAGHCRAGLGQRQARSEALDRPAFRGPSLTQNLLCTVTAHRSSPAGRPPSRGLAPAREG